MSLEAFAAIGLTGSLIQFVDFSCKLFSQTRQVYSSAAGLSSNLADLSTITTTLLKISNSFPNSPPSRPHANRDASLDGLLQSCKNAAAELLKGIEDVRSKHPTSKFSSFRSCLKGVWKQDQIDHMARQLDSFRGQLILQLEVMASEDNSKIMSDLRDLRKSSIESNVDMSNQIASLKGELLSALERTRQELMYQGQRWADPKFGGDSTNAHREPACANDINSLLDNLYEAEYAIQSVSLSLHLLKSLQFPGMEARHDAIRKAHPATCIDIFREKLGPWLSAQNSVFWVSGKPGSGKSTLMKFLSSYPETTVELKKWAGTRKLVIASHYLWIGGTTIQKSQEGLLRSILFGILQQRPDLVKRALADGQHLEKRNSDGAPHQLTLAALERAFQNLAAAKVSDVCYCIFIDGLDEFHGDKDDLIDILKALASMPNMKLCVASRPWNVFESAFGSDVNYKLYLQDLNADAIAWYVEDNLECMPEFQELITDEVSASDITLEIVFNAQGVFLWVFLVVRSLREGIRNFDRLADLRKRLREFPKDLDDFFRQIFDSMEPVYRTSASRILQIAIAANQPLSTLNYWWADIEEADPDFMFALPNNAVPSSSVATHRRRAIKKRVNGRLKGLLEVTNKDHEKFSFLHRTVKDFLMTEDMYQLLRAWSPLDFDPSLAICKTTLAELKSDAYWRDLGYNTRTILKQFYTAAKEYEARAARSTYGLILELESTIDYLLKVQKPNSEGELLLRDEVFMGSGRTNAWTHAASWGLELAVSEWLRKKSKWLSDKRKGCLLHTAVVFSAGFEGPGEPNLSMMQCIWKVTPATLSVSQISSLESGRSIWNHNKDKKIVYKALDLLAEHGTDLSSLVIDGWKPRPAMHSSYTR